MRPTASVCLALVVVVGAGCPKQGEERGARESSLLPDGSVVDSSVPGDGGDAATGSTKLPCDVQAVVQARCAHCHGAEPEAGAPMPLVTREDFLARSALSGEAYYHVALLRLQDERNPMPPTSQLALSAHEHETLARWLSAGVPAESSLNCDGSEHGADAGNTDAGGDDAHAFVEKVQFDYDPISAADCDADFELRASDPTDSRLGFPVGGARNSLDCFVFEVPFEGKAHGLKFTPLIDNKRVLHHWLLYAEAGSSGADAHYRCTGAHPDAELIAGWAPGMEGMRAPKGVGLRLPEKSQAHFVLEIHYNNPTDDETLRDKSGVRVCASTQLRPEEAGMHWLGSENIVLPPGAGRASGTCTAPQAAIVISSFPHMHKLGTRTTFELTRAGQTVTLLDKPFQFEDQRSYDTPYRIEAGDKLRVSCRYHNDAGQVVYHGPASEDEMCYNFVLAYPMGALSHGESTAQARSVCIDPE